MNSLQTAPPNEQRRKWSSHKSSFSDERYTEHKRLVGLVAATFNASRNIPVIVACSYNPDAPSGRSPKWSPQVAEYLADVELAVRHAFKFKPEADREELLDAWVRFLGDDKQVDKVQSSA